MESYEEDPVEAYNRAFQRKRWEKEQEEKKKNYESALRMMRLMRYLAIGGALLAIVTLFDQYLPATTYHENLEFTWQKRQGRGKYNRQGELVSYIRTKNFEMAVPHDVLFHLPVLDYQNTIFSISASPIFHIPTEASYVYNGYSYSFSVGRRILLKPVPFAWLLLFSALYTIRFKEPTQTNFVLGFFPALLALLLTLSIIIK